MSNFREDGDIYFVALYTIELILKLVGFGVRPFFKDKFNLLDVFIVVVSLIDSILKSVASVNKNSLLILQFCKAMRALRMLKLARHIAGMRRVLERTANSLNAIVGFSGLLLMFMYIWALMGMELFAFRAILD